MRRLIIWFCMAMLFAGPGIIKGEAANGGGRRPEKHYYSPGAESGLQGGPMQLSRRINELIQAGKYQKAQHLAELLLSRQEKRLGPESPQVAANLQRLANINMGLHNWMQAITLYQRALQIREKVFGRQDHRTAATMAHLGWAYTSIGAFKKALPLLERALAIREKVLGPDHPGTAESLALLANLKRETGSQAQALSLAQKALQIREKNLGPNHPKTADSLDLCARIYQQQGNLNKALPLAERALKIKEQALGPNHPETAKTQRILGLLQQQRQDYVGAEASFRKGQGRHQAWGGLTEVYLATGRYAEALKTLEALPKRAKDRPQVRVQFYTQRGQALQGLGRRGEAATDYLKAIKIIEMLRIHSPGERSGFFQAGMVKGYYQSYLALIGLLAEMSRKGEAPPASFRAYGPDAAAVAFYFAESVKGRALLESMAAKARKGSSQDIPPDLATQERQLQARRRALQSRWEETFQPHYGRVRDARVFLSERAALQKDQKALIEELRRRAPRYAALYYPKPYPARELPLKSGEVLLEYVLGDKESYLFRVQPGGSTQIIPLAVTRQALAKRLGALLAPFRKPGLRREDLARFSVAEAAALYRQLMAPALSGISPGRHLIIVPDEVLGAFPFEALVVQQARDWPQSILVGDRWPVTYSQSAAILALNRHLGRSQAKNPLFALGDCIYDAASPRYLAYKAGQGRAGELAQNQGDKPLTMSAAGSRITFAPLPETRRTVTNLAHLFGENPKPPQVLLDVEATETVLRQVPLKQYRYLFFGTHGFLAYTLGGIKEPVLVLTQVDNQPPDNGLLTFEEVLHFKLDADLVSLAACMTGVGQVIQGEGVVNFARAFEQAGARSVMVTLWNIPVDESLRFYDTFFKALKTGKTRTRALQAARQSVREKEPHPYFWSGIILHGEG